MNINMERIMSIRTHGLQADHRVGGIVGVSLESLLGRGPKERPKAGHRHVILQDVCGGESGVPA